MQLVSKIVAIIICVSISVTHAIDVTIQEGVNGYSGCTDAQLNNQEVTNNFGTGELNITRSWYGYYFKGLIKFDLSAITNVGTVSSAVLHFYISSGYGSPGDVGLTASRCLVDWGEGNKNGATATSGECSWSSAQYGSVNWTSGGCSSVGSDRGVNYGYYSTNSINNSWISIDVTETVDSMLCHSVTNYGWVLDDSIAGAETNRIAQFKTSEDATSSLRPYLTITYTGSCTPVTGTNPSNRVDTVGQPGRFKITTTGTVDSLHILNKGTLDSVAIVATKDSVAWRAKDSATAVTVDIQIFSCGIAIASDTVSFLWTMVYPAVLIDSIRTPAGSSTFYVNDSLYVYCKNLRSTMTMVNNGVSVPFLYVNTSLFKIKADTATTLQIGIDTIVISNGITADTIIFDVLATPLSPPVHVSGPSNKSVVIGSNYIDTVHFTGATSFRWQTDWGVDAWENLFGRTDSIINYATVTLDINGWKFRCIAANADGYDTSTVATLTVTEPPPVEIDSVRRFTEYVNIYPGRSSISDVYGSGFDSYVVGQSYVIINSIGRSDTLRNPALWTDTHITDTLLAVIPKGPKSVQVRRSDGTVSAVSSRNDSLYLYKLKGSIR